MNNVISTIIKFFQSGDKDVPDYIASANAWNNGQDIALPNTADIKLATEARGTDPFTPFVEHQDKYIVLLATGGTLTSLAQADTGSLAGGAQMEVWREIVARDGVLISDAFNRGLFRRYLECAFPGKPIAAEFRLSNDKQPTASEIADLAGKLKVAGWRIKQEELEEAVGYTLEKDDGGQGLTALPSMVGRGVPSAPFMNKAIEKVGGESRSTKDGEIPLSTSTSSLLSSFAQDTGPAAEAVAKLLQNPSKEAAEQLLADLPSLLPDDPALAAVIADEMAKAMAAELSSAHDTSPEGRGRSPSAPQSNKDGVCTSPNGPAGCQSPTCPGKAAHDEGSASEKQDIDTKVKAVKKERIAEIVSANTKGLVSVEEGLAVVLSDPVFKDKNGREMKFDSSFASKYRYGHGRSMNESDIDRFRRVQDAIYAVTHDEHPIVTFKGRKIIETTDLPRGSQRCYRTDTTNGETWAISWADKVYVRSIQERPKNNPPYKS